MPCMAVQPYMEEITNILVLDCDSQNLKGFWNLKKKGEFVWEIKQKSCVSSV